VSIKHAILGLLSWRPSTGYELKKLIEGSSFMYWSGNNNQIYRSLVGLLEDGLVTSETQFQEGSPARKTYTITGEGMAELRDWAASPPEPPDFKRPFLVQLAWSDQLGGGELDDLLLRYENEIRMQILMQQEKNRRGVEAPGRTPREAYLWEMIAENIMASYRNELAWVRKTRDGLSRRKTGREAGNVDFKVFVNGDVRYLECFSAKAPLSTEQDALDLVALCGENGTNLLMLHGEALSGDFFRLRTGVAGRMLQKFVNYNLRTAAVISDPGVIRGRFREMAAEANKGSHFRVFQSREDARAWLLSRS
jgi:DNA-binding PadR family transcriptional regulator